MQLPEYRVSLALVPPHEQAIGVPYPANVGKRTKLGGEPDWLHADETPTCPGCAGRMSFVAQIDSLDYGEPEGRGSFRFGEAGIIYVFYCFPCGRAAAVAQSE